MRRHLWRIVVVMLAVALVSCQAPAAKNASSRSGPAARSGVKSAPKKAPPKKAPPKKADPKDQAKKKPAKPAPKELPRLVDLGSTTCIPCKMMTPILDELGKEYKGQLKVEFVDVRKDAKTARKYSIRVIPTQVFFDAKGKEFFRHEGFYPKDDILRKFKDQGIALTPPKPKGE